MEKVSFTVDAGIINRLGLELVAKSETALAELIKNSYDADANCVRLFFENARSEGGDLTIDDDGVGMDRTNLINGFMRLATSDKIHNSISDIYKRPKAGRKGIGRFSTQRLGHKLVIETQTQNQNDALSLIINWDDYQTDKEVSSIQNVLEVTKRNSDKKKGTILKITNLREKWSDADIKRVYRYVAGLIQPNLLKIATQGNVIEEDKKEGFEVEFYARNNDTEDWKKIADPQVMLLNRALVVFSGYIDENGIGKCSIETKDFHIDGKKVKLRDQIDVTKENQPYELLKGTELAYKIYYFIGGDRNVYYGITRSELKVIIDYLNTNGGVKLYRNGFRVAKYGEIQNDWLNISKNSRIAQGIPFEKNRLLGFVQLIDPKGRVFEESAGREGLIEKEAFYDMQNFTSNGLVLSFKNFASWFRNTDEYKSANPDKKTPSSSSSILKIADDLKVATKTLSNPGSSEEEKVQATITIEQVTKKIVSETKAAINELEMMRVLAGVGLTIAEFIHEIKQFIPSLHGYINNLLSKNLESEVIHDLNKMQNVLKSFISYTSYFDETISKNIIRDLKPVDIREVSKEFMEVVQLDLTRRNIELKTEFTGYDLISTPMHPSEWNTILQNLYSNAKKAILGSGNRNGKMLLKVYKNSDDAKLILDFYDNGTGIPVKYQNRIFDAFFTNPEYNQNNSYESQSGSGLGLYILSQMIKNRNGSISIGNPLPDYKTCIHIELPLATIN